MSPDDLCSLQALQGLNPKECTEQLRVLYVAVAIRLGEDNPTDRAQAIAETRRWFQYLDWSEQPIAYMSSYNECSRDGNATWMQYRQLYPLDHDRLLLMKHLKEQCDEWTHTTQYVLEKIAAVSKQPLPLDLFIEQWDASNNTRHLSTFIVALSSVYPLEQMTRAHEREERLQHVAPVFHMLSDAMQAWKEPTQTLALPSNFAEPPL